MDIELDRFKSDISLADFAQAEYGYTKDKAKSSRNSLVLRIGSDTVVITRGEDGHDVYFSRADENDCGSIIDFVKNRVGDNNAKLVRVRQVLRPWCPGSKRPAAKMPARSPERPVAASKDMAQVLAKVVALKPYSGQYLIRERKLDPDVIAAFNVLQDERGNACFVHRSIDGITGWEVKNNGYKGFSAGGLNSLFMAQLGPPVQIENVQKVMITEAVVDCMSHAQMKYQLGMSVLYIGTAGAQLSELQQISLKHVLAAACSARVVLAMDNDLAGHVMAERVQSLEPGRPMVRELPKYKDWSEDLVAGASCSATLTVDAG